MVGEERHERRDHAEPLDERVPERAQGHCVAVPEAAPRAADVPVRDVVDERLVRANDLEREPALVPGGRLAHQCVGPLDEPAVEWLELAVRPVLEVAPPRRPASDVRVVDEELARVPERQQPALDLVCGTEAEEEVLVRRLRAVLPAHDVRAHAGERVGGVDRVPPRAVHLAPVLVEHLLVAEHLAERGPARERDRHEELRVEPEADLLAHLRDPVRREPFLPVAVIREVGAGEPLRRSSRIAARHVLGALPAERGEGDDPGVEPHVAHLGDPAHLLAARLAPDRDGVDPRAPQLLELLDRSGRARQELGLRADHVQVPARARVEGEREPVVAAPRDVPVAHVAQPVVHALAHVGRRPLDRRVRVEQRLAELVDGDQPVVGDAPDERGVAAPAMGIAVLVRPRLDEEARLREAAHDLIRGLDRREPVQPPVACRRSGPPRPPGRAPGGRGGDRARSPPGRHRARCGRCPCPPRARPRPTESRGARPRRRARGDRRRARGSARRRGPRRGRARRTRPSDSARRRPTRPFSRRPYSASGFTAAATFAGSVQGVVVQTTRDSCGRSSSGKRT